MPEETQTYPFDHHTWAGEDADKAPEYQAQMALPVHALDGFAMFKVDPRTRQLHDDGDEMYLPKTACGICLGTEVVRTTDVIVDVTCEACNA